MRTGKKILLLLTIASTVLAATGAKIEKLDNSAIDDAMWMVAGGFIIFMIPVVGGWIIVGLSGITDLLRDYMDS